MMRPGDAGQSALAGVVNVEEYGEESVRARERE